MRQATLKLKSYTQNVNIIDNGNLQLKILHIMLYLLLALSVFYVLFLGNMVFNIVERKALEVNANRMSNEVADLELEYLSLSKKIDLEFAHSLGFRETETTYATRNALGSIKVAQNEI